MSSVCADGRVVNPPPTNISNSPVGFRNEPMTIHRQDMFDTWRACTEAIVDIIPDMAVSIMDVGEGSVFPGRE